MNNKQCVICGFDKRVHLHHIIKRKECGSDKEDNLVYLCPNHHWIADFGGEEDRLEIIEMIKKITGKCGTEISDEEKKILDRKIRALEEEILCLVQKEKYKSFSDEEWEKHKETWNYETTRKWLLGRGCSKEQSYLLHRRSEILLLIRLLRKELEEIKL